MKVLVFVETAEGKVKKTSIEAVAYAKGMGGDVTAIALGDVDKVELENLGKYGAAKVLHAADARLNHGLILPFASVLTKAMEEEQADVLVLAGSALGTPVAARVAVRLGADIATNIVSAPEAIDNGLRLKKSIYTGKAFAWINLTSAKKVIVIRKNAASIQEAGARQRIIIVRANYELNSGCIKLCLVIDKVNFGGSVRNVCNANQNLHLPLYQYVRIDFLKLRSRYKKPLPNCKTTLNLTPCVSASQAWKNMSINILEQLEQFAKEDPDDPFNHYALAMEYLKTNVAKAQSLLEQLTVNHSGYVPTYYQLGQLYAAQGRSELALTTFERGIMVGREAGEHKAVREMEGARLAILYDN